MCITVLTIVDECTWAVFPNRCHSQIYRCGFPSGHIGNFRGFGMQGESVAMAAHPACVLTTVTSRLAEEALGNSRQCAVYSLHVIFARTLHVSSTISQNRMEIGVLWQCSSQTMNHLKLVAGGKCHVPWIPERTQIHPGHKNTAPPLMFLKIFIITDIL